MKVGSIQIVPIIDGTAYEPWRDAVQHPEGNAWECPQHAPDERGRLRFDIGSFLIRAGDRTALVDTGGGMFSSEGTTTGALLDNLRAQGVNPEDVTDVLFTHMHWDHIGWSTQGDEITFPNATVHVHQDDWAHFVTGDTAVEKIREVALPLEPRISPFSTEGELIPGVLGRPAPGHTPGTTIYIVHDAGERALLLGDAVHTVGELTEPEWFGMWDVDREAARAMRDRLARELIATGDPFAPAHFPELSFGRLASVDGLRRFTWEESLQNGR